MKHRRLNGEQRGVVLVISLVLLAVAAVALAGVAGRSATEALAAREAERSLGQRWLVRSAEATLLPAAEAVLRAQEEGLSGGGIGNRVDLVFAAADGQTRVRVAVSDKSAKVQADALLVRGEDAAEGRLRDLLRHQGLAGSRVRLRPLPEEEGERGPSPARVLSYAQVFEAATPEELMGRPPRPGLAAGVTLWGDGRLHFGRASPAAMEAVLSPELSAYDINRLARERDRVKLVGVAEADASLEGALDRLDLREGPRRAAAERLSARGDGLRPLGGVRRTRGGLRTSAAAPERAGRCRVAGR